jgi:hypothetical protein
MMATLNQTIADLNKDHQSTESKIQNVREWMEQLSKGEKPIQLQQRPQTPQEKKEETPCPSPKRKNSLKSQTLPQEASSPRPLSPLMELALTESKTSEMKLEENQMQNLQKRNNVESNLLLPAIDKKAYAKFKLPQRTQS